MASSIRPAEPFELDRLRAIEVDAAERFREVGLDDVADSPPQSRESLERARLEDRLWVAEVDGMLVGMALTVELAGATHLAELDVLREHQGRGLGGALLEHVCRVATAAGHPTVTLHTFADVPWNAAYYARRGFVELAHDAMGPALAAATRADAAHFPGLRRVCMRRLLPGAGPSERASIAAADAVLVVTGMLADDEGEADLGAGDRASLALPEEEVTLLREVAALHPRVVVVLEGGASITVEEWVDDVEAVLFAFYPGQQGGLAIADVLFGDVAPSGRLPFSVPAREADLPRFDSVSHEVTYDLWHGYRHLQRQGAAPRYPFGHGLTYTRFTYGALSLSSSSIGPDDDLVVTVDVTNAGAARAIETVQLYVRALRSRVERAPRELRAFAQVDLPPGETRTVVLALDAQDLAFWDAAAGAFEVERTDYEVEIGASAEDLRVAAPFRVE